MANELLAIIGGSGLADALGEQIENSQTHDIETPFGKTSAPVIVGDIAGRQIAFLNRHGLGHTLPPSKVPYAANIFALKQLGARAIIASGAVGSLQEKIAPGDLVIVDQFIDKTFKRQTSFFDDYGAVHCELANPTCGRLGKKLIETAGEIETNTHPAGTYVCMEGPQFSTRAESLMHRNWGADLIGMTAMPEAKLAREAQICYALVALASDYDCWKPPGQSKDKQTLLKEIIGNLQHATANCLKLITAVLQSDHELICNDCHCRKSLELAVWTAPDKIEPAKKEKLDVLFK
ncbi:S-methyl-5'-thioadenosine phosphorylase [Planctomycetota bacterium]